MTRADFRRIMIAVNEIEGACALVSKKIGVKENTLTLLYALDDGLPHSQKEICEQWLLPKTTLNTIVRECVEEGLLVLCSSGGREKEICLTEQGRAYARQVLAQVYRLEQAAAEETEAMTPATAEAMSLFAQNFKEETEKYIHGT